MSTSQISLEEYNKLKSMGFLYEFFPKATGNYKNDVADGVIPKHNKKSRG